MNMTRERLFKYANDYRIRAEKSGRGSDYPTVRRAARSLGYPQSMILQVAEDAKDWGLCLDIAIGIQGNGAYGLYETEADYQLETWDEEK